MSGSHYATPPGRDGRYSLEDTIYDLPVTPAPASPAPQPADSGDYTYTPPSSAEWVRASSGVQDCTVWTERIEARAREHDARLRALELAMSALMVSADTRSLPLTATATAYLDAVSQACDGQPTLRSRSLPGRTALSPE